MHTQVFVVSFHSTTNKLLSRKVDIEPNAPCFRELDLTSKFVGRTAHAEYLYSGFEGHWIGPYGDGSDISMAEYDGYLRASTEQNIYDPGSGVRLHFEDCYEGFVCIRSRWREDDISGNGNNPDSRYLQVTNVTRPPVLLQL